MSMITNIIVQAGGRGSRLRHHTWNKPKCLVSVRGKPILYHLFDRFPNAKFHIIGDYQYEQLEAYLKINKPTIEYTLLKASGAGTSSGINKVNTKGNSLLIWGDLIVNSDINIESDKPVLITTDSFTCRWSVKNNTVVEDATDTDGVPGIFYFPDSSVLNNVRDNLEFVKWFGDTFNNFDTVNISLLEELGDFKTIESENERSSFARFFNQVEIKETTVHKRAVDKDYEHLIGKEQVWYKAVSELGFKRIPKIISTNPYVMSRINGAHAYEMPDLTEREKRAIIADYIESLNFLHSLDNKPSVTSDLVDNYITKTIDRVKSISSIITNFDKEFITINGLKCRNVFAPAHRELLDNLMNYLTVDNFYPIHGDCTFSNSMIDNNLKVWYIDPRGYFGSSIVYGDKYYDFAKLYYSAMGNYDYFNRRKFKLYVDDDTVEVLLPETGFEQATTEVFKEQFGDEVKRIKIIHGLLWLSLTGYVKDDIDSIVGSFYYGLYWLEQAL